MTIAILTGSAPAHDSCCVPLNKGVTSFRQGLVSSYELASPSGVSLIGTEAGDLQAVLDSLFDASATTARIGKTPQFANIQGSNIPGLNVPDGGILWIQQEGGPAAVGVTRSQRYASYTGGTPGVVNTASYSYSEVGPNVATFEWAALGHVNSSATGGQNVGVYAKGTKRSSGPVWGAVSEVEAIVGSTGIAVAHEFDVWAIGPDDSNSRIGLDVVVGKGGQTGAAPEVFCGVRVGPQDGSTANGSFKNGIFLFGNMTVGALIQHTGTYGVLFSSTSNIATGIDFASATFSSIAMRFTRAQKIMSFEGTNTAVFEGFGASDSIAKMTFSGAEKIGFDVENARVRVNGVQVLASRDTGWAPMTGTPNKAAVYDTAAVTLPQLAGRVAQMQAAMTAHGLLGA